MNPIRLCLGQRVRAGAMALPVFLAFSAAAAGDPQDPPAAARARPAAGAPALPPLTILAVDPSGAVRVRLGPCPDPGEGPAQVQLFLHRVRPGAGGAGEMAVLDSSELVEFPREGGEAEVFRGGDGAPAAGPGRIELRRFRDGATEETAEASADLWRGDVPEWIAAVQSDRKAALDLLAAWKGDGHPDDYAALARVEEIREFASLQILHEIYQEQDHQAGLARLRGVKPREGEPAPAPYSVSEPEAGAPKEAPAGAVPPESRTIGKVRIAVGREAAAHFLLAAEWLVLRAGLPGVSADERTGADWAALGEALRTLVAEDADLRKVLRTADLAPVLGPQPDPARAAERTDRLRRIRRLRAGLAA